MFDSILEHLINAKLRLWYLQRVLYLLLLFGEHKCLIIILVLFLLNFLVFSSPVYVKARNSWFVIQYNSLNIRNNDFRGIVLNILLRHVIVVDIVPYLIHRGILNTLKNSYFLKDAFNIMAVIPSRSFLLGIWLWSGCWDSRVNYMTPAYNGPMENWSKT